MMSLAPETPPTRISRSASSPSPRKMTPAATRRAKFDAENTHPNLPSDSDAPAKQRSQKSNVKEKSESESDVNASDPSVKVVARIRPVGVYERSESVVVKRLSSNSLAVEDKMYFFDSVFDSNSNQEDVFQMVGVPLVRDSMAGFNTSILSYGQTGSGKTYTMWGPQSSMVEGFSSSVYQGIVPRVFNMLFAEIQKETQSSDSKLANYQCRCSFLEIYNEHITDLLDPAHRKLEIQEDAKNGIYVENLTEEYVNSAEEVTQILIKGLSNRKFGSTKINSKSSRSHIIFSCVVESWSKATLSQSISSSKSSRMSFIDLAGSEKSKLEEAGKECIKDARNVNRSLSRLGKLVNVLAGASDSEGSENLPYRSSCLTNLLRETLGGNAKLTVICAISPTSRCKGETLSTLRFGQKAKKVLNNAVVNEITEDAVNDLSEQIRQLKEELISEKLSGQRSSSNFSRNFQGHRARESLNQLRVSLNRSLILPRIEKNDLEEEEHIDEVDVQELCVQFESLHEIIPQANSSEENSDVASYISQNDNMSSKVEEVNSHPKDSPEISVLEEPVQCESPKMQGNLKKSTIIELARSSFQKGALDSIRSSLSRSMLAGPTESLAASLRRGLQIIDIHQRKPTFDNVPAVPCLSLGKLDNGVQTLGTCDTSDNNNHVEKSLNMWMVRGKNNGRFDSDDGLETYPQAIKKLMELKSLCASQAATIELLNNQVAQFKEEIGDIRKGQHPDVKCLAAAAGEQKASGQYLVAAGYNKADTDTRDKEELLEEIERLKIQLQSQKNALEDVTKIQATTISSILEDKSEDELDKERERWTEAESRWICLTEELRLDLESNRRFSEKIEHELLTQKQYSAEMDDALQRAILGHVNIVEHYTELQEKYEALHWKHRKIMEGIAEMKRAAAKVGKKSGQAVFMESLAAELSVLKVEKEKERQYLKKENRGLRIQLRDTAEAVHAAGELLVRLREAEEFASVAEANYQNERQEAERLKKQVEKMKRKHAIEIATMKNYLAESRLPESALKPGYEKTNPTESERVEHTDDQDWRSAFGTSYRQEL